MFLPSFAAAVLNGCTKPLYWSASLNGAVPTSHAKRATPLADPTISPPNLTAFFAAVVATSPILFHILTDYPLVV